MARLGTLDFIMSLSPSLTPLLENIRILDLSRLLPGPYATMLLTDMGAEVIKVETPRVGDYARHLPDPFGGDSMYQMLNQGKKSLGINFRNKRGREIFLQLAERVDVIVEAFKPGSVVRWGTDYEAVQARNPRIVYCSLSGYGQTGPYRDRVGHDLNYIAIGGLLGLSGRSGGPPIPPGVQIADLAGGMMAAIAILAALFGRERTGQGSYLDVAMLDTVISWVLPVAGSWFFKTGQHPQRGNLSLSGSLPCYNIYQTADGVYLSLGALEPPFWSSFCQVVERPDLIKRSYDPHIIPEVASIFKEKSRAEWLLLFKDLDVCLEPVNNLEEMMNDPQVRHRGLVENLGSESGAYPRPGSPLPFSTSTRYAPAPDLGQHTLELLNAAGISSEEIEELNQRGIIKISQGQK